MRKERRCEQESVGDGRIWKANDKPCRGGKETRVNECRNEGRSPMLGEYVEQEDRKSPSRLGTVGVGGQSVRLAEMSK